MNCCLVKNDKIWKIIALVVIVVGMAMLGIFGLNKTVDYKASYEVIVSVDQDIDGSANKAQEATEAYFKSVGAKTTCLSVQLVNEGTQFIYKFTDVKSIVKDSLLSAITTKVNNPKVDSEVEINEVVANPDLQIAYFVGAIAIIAVAVFAYLWIFEGIASALAVVASSALSVILFISLISIARVPAFPTFGLMIAIALVINLILSSGLVNRIKEEVKSAGNAGLTKKEIAGKALENNLKRFLILGLCLVGISGFLVGIGLATSGNMAFIGISLLIATICAFFTAITATPYFWTVIKKK